MTGSREVQGTLASPGKIACIVTGTTHSKQKYTYPVLWVQRYQKNS
jgi:hypothetical protein